RSRGKIGSRSGYFHDKWPGPKVETERQAPLRRRNDVLSPVPFHWAKTALMIQLTPEERQTLLAWQRSTTITAGRARRGRVILLLAARVPIPDIAATVGISRRFVYKWAQRFVQNGLEGLADKPGRGGRQKPRSAASERPAL